MWQDTPTTSLTAHRSQGATRQTTFLIREVLILLFTSQLVPELANSAHSAYPAGIYSSIAGGISALQEAIDAVRWVCRFPGCGETLSGSEIACRDPA